jgi:hypothetical protein
MVQAVENRTEVVGTIADVGPDPGGSPQTLIAVDVERSAPVEGFPDLLGEVTGTRIEVRLRNEAATGLHLQVGRTLQAWVERVSPTVLVADPEHVRCDDI